MNIMALWINEINQQNKPTNKINYIYKVITLRLRIPINRNGSSGYWFVKSKAHCRVK